MTNDGDNNTCFLPDFIGTQKHLQTCSISTSVTSLVAFSRVLAQMWIVAPDSLIFFLSQMSEMEWDVFNLYVKILALVNI